MQKKKHVKEAIRFYSQMLFKITSCMFCCIIPCFAWWWKDHNCRISGFTDCVWIFL